ncbi:tetraspanin-8 [Aegotheles albertisi]
MAGVSSCMKYSMFIFNFIFWLCGSIILGVSIWIRASQGIQQDIVIDSSVFVGVDLLIAVGSIIMVLGFLGCCGAIKESRCMLMSFFIGLLLIVILQLTGGILGAVYRSQLEASLNLTLEASLDSFQSTKEEYKIFHKQFHVFEEMNQCCGLVNGPADWGKNFNTDLGSNKICECKLNNPSTDLCSFFQGRYVYTTPCGKVIVKYLKDHLLIFIGMTFGLAVIELLGLGFSMSLYCQIRRK